MWVSKLFGSLPTLLDFVNRMRLRHDQFKIVVVPPRLWQRRGDPRYYLIYRTDEGEEALVGVSTAEVIDEEDAVDVAEEIIASAQGRGHGQGGAGV
jgi:hypothetical protein